jgi:DNA-binding HxlR family transcriptional regulator
VPEPDERYIRHVSKKKSYGQFCPVAQAAEVVAERWTFLVLRELILGSQRFNDLRKGVPLMSPSLLSQRLKELEESGVIEKFSIEGGHGSAYRLTRAGQELAPVIEMLGTWGHRWLRRDVRREELDPALLMWDVRRRVDPAAMPVESRVTVEFDLGGVPAKKSRWWLVFDRGEVDLCLKNPGYEIDLYVASHIRELVGVWMGHIDLRDALKDEVVRLEGTRAHTRAFVNWFKLSSFAGIERVSAEELVSAAQ